MATEAVTRASVSLLIRAHQSGDVDINGSIRAVLAWVDQASETEPEREAVGWMSETNANYRQSQETTLDAIATGREGDWT